MLDKILSKLFPVRFPNFHHVEIKRTSRYDPFEDIESGIGQVKRKKYRDAIDRIRKEGV